MLLRVGRYIYFSNGMERNYWQKKEINVQVKVWAGTTYLQNPRNNDVYKS